MKNAKAQHEMSLSLSMSSSIEIQFGVSSSTRPGVLVIRRAPFLNVKGKGERGGPSAKRYRKISVRVPSLGSSNNSQAMDDPTG